MARAEIVLGGAIIAGAAAYLLLGPSSAEASTDEESSDPFGELFGAQGTPELEDSGQEVDVADVPEPGDVSSWWDRIIGRATTPPVSSPGDANMRAFTGRVGDLPADEQAIILSVASSFAIDPVFLAALRKAENGGPQSVNPNYPRSGNQYRGGQFGIQTLAAPTFTDQATIAARTIANTVRKYQNNTGASATVGGRFTPQFIQYFSQGGPGYGGYAPTGADPLNAHHYSNLLAYYQGSTVTA